MSYPTTLDGTPTDPGRSEYGYDYLVGAGYFETPRSATVSYASGHEVTYRFSVDGAVRIAYVEFPMADVPRDTPTKIARTLKRNTRLQYVWVVDPDTDRVQVLRTSRGTGQFVYNPTVHTGRTAARKREKLNVAADDITVLFDSSDVVDRLDRDLRDHRIALAGALTTKRGRSLERQSALRAAGRIIDRLLFLYFLVERGVVVPVTDAGEMLPLHTSRVFDTLVDEHDDVWTLLRTVFFERLPSRNADRVRFTGADRLHVPYLNGDLLEPAALTTSEGHGVSEADELVVEGFDWAALVDDLNEYSWRLAGLDGTHRADADTVGPLTPGVLGYIYEKFGSSVRNAGDDGRLAEVDAAEQYADRSAGTGEVGAHYTGDAVTDFKTRRALWQAVLATIDEDLADGNAPAALDPSDLYRPGAERHEAIEADGTDGFEVLYDACDASPDVLAYLDSKLREVTVCDPAVGSGSFALAVANTLLEWRSMCRPDADESVLRRQIITGNVFGVDIQAGATEICRLRLWLWLLGGTPVETTAGASVDDRDALPPLPDVSFDVRTGNSLLGFTDTAAGPGHGHPPGSDAMAERLREYAAALREYRESAAPDADAKRALERRHDDLQTDLDERYARAQRDPEGARLTIPDHVADADAAWDSLHAAPGSATTLRIELPDGIPDVIEDHLDARGFTIYTYRARVDGATLDRDDVAAIFEHLRRHVADADAWSVVIERAYAGRDFRADDLDACHWPLEFPLVFLANDGFDVVLSNPPYGAAIPPGAEPVLTAETNYDCQGTTDSCEWFYERALDLARDRGVISYVVPKSIAYYSSWADIRERLLHETEFRHVYDVGLGFVGVNLETIAIVTTLGPEGRSSTPTVHRSRDLRSPTANQSVHLGWVDQEFMLDSETIIFRPITADQSDVLERLRAHDRRLGDVMSTDDTTRQLYIPDDEKRTLDGGTDHYINKNPWVQAFYLEDIWHRDLGDYRASVEEYAVPRVMLKVLRGTRLRAWIDADGEVVGTEKLVNVPLEDCRPEEIAFVYAALNHPCASFYLQKAIFSETTESARVMDGQYSTPIPIPSVASDIETAVARLAWTLTLARQVDHDSNRELSDRVATLHAGLNAILSGLYLDIHAETIDRWCATVPGDGTETARVQTLFDRFYTERFATRDGDPSQYWDEIEAVVDAHVDTVSQWDTHRISNSHWMAVVTDVL